MRRCPRLISHTETGQDESLLAIGGVTGAFVAVGVDVELTTLARGCGSVAGVAAPAAVAVDGESHELVDQG